MKSGLWIAVFLIAGVAGYLMWSGRGPATQADTTATLPNGAMVEVEVPTALSENAQIGKRAFDANCAACHGTNGAGQDGVAPPLVHLIYEPGHHGDESFQRAVALGVQSHHWPFGDMPLVDGLTRGDVTMVIAYIRELQQANGIR